MQPSLLADRDVMAVKYDGGGGRVLVIKTRYGQIGGGRGRYLVWIGGMLRWENDEFVVDKLILLLLHIII